MDPRPFIEAATELRERFVTLLDSLSTASALVTLGAERVTENTLLNSALQVLINNQDLERCSIFMLRNGVLECAAGLSYEEFLPRSPDSSSHQPSPMQFPPGSGIMGQALDAGQPIYCEDCQTDPRFLMSPESSGTATGSLLCVPIPDGDNSLGVINAFHPQSHYFEDWHRHILVLFAGILGQMVANNRLLHDMDRQVKARTRELEQTLHRAQQLKERYEQLSTIDELTGLYNRRFFFPEAEAALVRSMRYDSPFSLLSIDLDLFKQINDRYGHAAGDQVLRDVAAMLLEISRESDILARMGGEEFVLAVPHTTTRGAHELAERIESALAELSWQKDQHSWQVTASIGIAEFGTDPETDSHVMLDRLLQQADDALYHAKSSGRNLIKSYRPDAPTADDNPGT